ncbi:MAG TPA: hypothetical protein VFU76_01400 [Terriglobales bacterium]|nr:hypothetical protein [Terriglobales bacterium]
MKNITIAVEEGVASRARLLAAKRQTSVSQLLAEKLCDLVKEDEEYERAMRRALRRKPFLHSDGKYLTREEVYDRSRFR